MTDLSYNYACHRRLLVWSMAVILIIALNSSSKATSLVSLNIQTVSPNQTASNQTTPTELKLGQPIERELTGGTVHSYTFPLEANQYLNAVVEQKGIDVVVSVYNPAGEKIYEVDSPNGTDGPEPIYLITQVGGNYRLEVTSLEREAKPGNYEAKLTEVRASVPADIDRVAGFKALGEAALLRAEGKRESAPLIVKKYEEAIEKLEKVGEIREQAKVINLLGVFYDNSGNYEKAEPLYLKALEIRKRVLGENHPETVLSINNLAALYYEKHDYGKAEALYLKALEIRKRVLGENHPETLELIEVLGNFYYATGDYGRAEIIYIQALELYKKNMGENHVDTATTMSSLAAVYSAKGDYNKAEILYIRAVEIDKQALKENRSTDVTSINNLGILYYFKKDYEKAEPLLRQALEVRKRILGEIHPVTALSINNLGVLYQAKHDSTKAEALYIQALEIYRKTVGENSPNTALSINNLALLYQAKGEYEKAEPLFIQSLEIYRKTVGESHSDTVRSINNLALLYQAKGDINQAIQYSLQANDARENELTRNLSIGSERQKQLYLQLYASELDNVLSLHVQAAPKDLIARQSALTQILRRKGRSIDAVNQNIEALRKRSQPEDVTLLDELTKKKTALSNLTTQGLGKRTPEEYQQKLKTIQDEVEKLEYQISQRSAEFRVQAQPITLQAVQQAVPAEAALVEFASYHTVDTKANKLGTRRYVVYLLNNQGEPQWADLGEAEPIDQLVDELRTKLRSKQTDVDTEVKPLARKLDELVMKPVRNLTGKGKRLLVAPDGKLNLVPFAALVDEQGKFLVENYDISYLTSGRDLLRLQVKIDSKQAPVIIGDPDFGPFPQAKDIKEGSTIFARLGFRRLASTELEAKAIKEIFPTGDLLLQEKATELALDNVNAPSILHIATHGFFLAEKDTIVPEANTNRQPDIIGTDNSLSANSVIENPLLRSGLALAGANLHTSDQDNQGIFTALKTTALNLWGTKVVVLSACDTGVGEVKTGDGIYGLRRALVLAGSETQLMSLWPVSDTGTKELMVDYYQRLQQGEGRADALRQVQLELLKNKTHQHPFYWASFIQSGEWANLAGKR